MAKTVQCPKCGHKFEDKENDIPNDVYYIDYYFKDEDDVTHAWVEAEDVWNAITEFFHEHWGVTRVSSIYKKMHNGGNAHIQMTDRMQRFIDDFIGMSSNSVQKGNTGNNNFNNSKTMGTMNNSKTMETMNNSQEAMMEKLMQMLVKQLSQNKEQQRAFFGSMAEACGLEVREKGGFAQQSTEVEQVQEKVNKSVRQRIKDSAWVANVKLFHNHAERQMYRMLGTPELVKRDRDEYTKNLTRIEYGYQFKQTIKQLGNMCHLEKKDPQGYNEIARCYTHDNVVGLLEDDLKRLTAYCESAPRHNCYSNKKYNNWLKNERLAGRSVNGDRAYIKLRGISDRNASGAHCSELDKGTVFVSELSVCVFNKLQQIINKAAAANNCHELLKAVREYDSIRIRLNDDTKKSARWINAFKMLGAYRTLVNLVRFDGLEFQERDITNTWSDRDKTSFIGKERSLGFIEYKADEIVNDKWLGGYAMLGILRVLIKRNNLTEWPSKKD